MSITLRIATSAAIVALASIATHTLSAGTIYSTTLSGANEVPPTGSPGTGNALVTLTGDLLTVNETFSGLVAPASAAHIHCCGPIGFIEPVAVPFTGFPNATSGSYTQSFDLTLTSTYTGAFVTANGGTAAGAEAALIAALNSGQTYANIHDVALSQLRDVGSDIVISDAEDATGTVPTPPFRGARDRAVR